MTIGQRIKEAREEAQLTQTELAERVGVRYQSVQQWEADKTAPARAKMTKLAAALGKTVAELEFGDSPALEDTPVDAKATGEAREIAAAWDSLPEAKKRLYREAILHDAAMSVVFPEIAGSVAANASYHSMIARIRKSRAQLERQMKLKLDP